MNIILKMLFYITVFSPTIFIYGLALFKDSSTLLLGIYSVAASIILSLISWILIIMIQKRLGTMSIDIKKFESNDSALIPFWLTFGTPGILKIFDLKYFSELALLIVIFCGLSISYFQIHPILRLIGYRFYKIETENGMVATLITNRDIRNKNSIVKVSRIYEYLFIERN